MKINGFNEMKIIEYSNDIRRDFNKTYFINNTFEKEIKAPYEEKKIKKIMNNSYSSSFSIRLQKDNIFYNLNDTNFTSFFNKENICNENNSIYINDIMIENIIYCYINNTNEPKKNSLIFDIEPNEICYKCNKIRNKNNKKNASCNKTEGYYHKENDNSKKCYNNNTIENGYYLDINDKLYKKCNYRCLTCNKGGDDSNSNCLTCIKDYHFSPNSNNHCISFNELPSNSSYYLDKIVNKYIKCHEKCIICNGPNENNCISYNNQTFFFKKNHKRKLDCHGSCYSCNSNEPNKCTACQPNFHQKENEYTICYEGIPEGYYLKDGVLKRCHSKCKTCIGEGSDDHNNCDSCEYPSYLDDEKTTNCVEDDPLCGESCGKCFHSLENTVHGTLSEDKKCRRCSFINGYYPLQKYTNDQFYVYCYPSTSPPESFLFKGDVHKPCHKTCQKCSEIGDYTNHHCIDCAENYHFIDEEKDNCYPICLYYYYYNNYNQYKCTDDYKCPSDYPLLNFYKNKCLDSCLKDVKYKCQFKNDCYEDCPEGTEEYNYHYNGENLRKCKIDESFKEKNCKSKKNIYDYEMTDELLNYYAKKYIHDYPIAINYTTIYSPFGNDSTKYWVFIYKSAKCIEEYIRINLDNCIKKVKKDYNIKTNIVIELLYSPSNKIYNFYNIDNGEKLNLTSCKGDKISVSTSLLLNPGIDKDKVISFAELNVNLFDEKDPFFTDICYPYSLNGKDIPLSDRIRLFYQNISICGEGCSSVGIDLVNMNVECSCEIKTDNKDNKIDDIANMFMDSPLSSDTFAFITDSNLGILKCIKKALNTTIILYEYGVVIIAGIYLVEIILAILIAYQSKKVKNKIYSIRNKLKFPPKKTSNYFLSSDEKNNEKINDYSDDQIRYDKIRENNQKKYNYLDTLKENEKNVINIKKGKKIFSKKDNNFDYDIKSESNNGNDSLNLNKNQSVLKSIQESGELSSSNSQNFLNKINKKKNVPIFNKGKGRAIQIIDKGNKNSFNAYFYDGGPDIENDPNLRTYRIKMRNRELELMKNNQLEKGKNKLEGKTKKYDENELDELEFEDAVIFDKRKFCRIFWFALKQKHILIYTFCNKDSYKPFAIRLSIVLFSFLFYFIINGFLYNETYISTKLTTEEKTLSDYFNSYVERIVYTSLVGGLISFIISVLFNTEKKIEKAMEKRKKKSIVLVKKEMSEIYKCFVISLIFFIIIQFMSFSFFIIYYFCFYYVYPNNVMEWLLSSGIIIGIVQFTSFLTIFLLSFIKYISLKCKWKICFNINMYFYEQL